ARLRPGMTAEVDLSSGEGRQALLAPAEAVIRTGRRSLVIAVAEDGRYAPVEVAIGAAVGDRVEIVSGLEERQDVLASGQFLIDSEARLSGVLARLQAGGAPTGDAHRSTGQVTAIDDEGVTIAHEPVPDLNWPAMTMAFTWGSVDRQADLTIGDQVDF